MSGSPHWQRKIQFTCAVPELHSSVSAVLDDNSLRSLGNRTGGIPGHAIAGQTVKGHAGELSLESIADVRGIHVAVDAAGNRSLIDGVDDIVSIGSELVRGVTVGLLVSGDKGLRLFILCVCSERGQEHQTLGQRGVKALNGQDAVHAVAAEEDRRIAALVGGNQDLRSLLIVDGQEYEISTGLLALGNLRGQIRLVVSGEGLCGNDLQPLDIGLGLELLINTGRIGIGGVIDDADLGAELVFCDIICGGNALVGVGKADLEHIVAALDDSGRRSGRRHHKQVVIGGLGGNGNGRGGGDRTGQNLQAPVLQGVVGVDALLGVMLIVLELPLKDIAAIGGVDLLDGQLLGVLNGLTVDGGAAGDGADAADLDGGAGVSPGALTGCLGSGSGGGGGSLRGGCRIGGCGRAAGGQAWAWR